MRKSEKIAATIAAGSVGMAGLLGVYTAHGPALSAPVVLTVPDVVMNVVCGSNAYGCYRTMIPDVIVMSTAGANDPATLPHEMLHYLHNGWSECEVSDYLFATQNLRDGYNRNDEC